MSVATEGVLPSYRAVERRGGSLRGVIAGGFGLAFVASTLVAATMYGQEAVGIALIVATMLLVVVMGRPEFGIFLLLTNYLFASYPTPIRGGGLLTINNVLGVILAVILMAELAQRPDFWFLRTKQVQILASIGGVLLLGTFASYWSFPDLRITWGKVRTLDQTAELSRDFITRFAFIILSCKFLTTKRHVKLVVIVMLTCLVLTVPSALLGWADSDSGDARAAASFSIGTNSNRLAFLCLMQAAFWWYLGQTQKSQVVRLITYAMMATFILTVLATASRSGFLGMCLLFYLLTRARGGLKSNRLKVMVLAGLAAGMMVTIIPQETLDRIANMNPMAEGHDNIGTHSTERRVETVGLGWNMFLTYPLFGVGLGNFREVARQVYADEFYRPPHNSYIWALSECGIFAFLLFLYLFYSTWRDILWLQRSPATPPDLLWIALAMEPTLTLLMFYSVFADMWLNPITYILFILTMIFKRYVSCRRVVLA